MKKAEDRSALQDLIALAVIPSIWLFATVGSSVVSTTTKQISQQELTTE